MSLTTLKHTKFVKGLLKFVPYWFISRGWVDCGMMTIMMMMVVIGVMMMMIKINFLNGTMVMKNKRFKKQKYKKSSYSLLGTHQGGRIGVCQ